MRLMSTLFFNFFQKNLYRKFVHSIYTYIIYSSCPNVLKIKHHLPLYTDNRGNNAAHHLSEDISIFGCNLYHILLTFISRKLCATLCLFRCKQYVSHIQKIFLYQKQRPELVQPNSLQDFVYFLCCLCDAGVLSCKYQDLTTQNLYDILLPTYELAYDNSLWLRSFPMERKIFTGMVSPV